MRSRLEGDDVGFIRITQFNEQTTADLKKAITDLTTQAGDKLKSFIIDLRGRSRTCGARYSSRRRCRVHEGSAAMRR